MLQIERLRRLASLARGEQELGYEVEVIEGELTAASVVDPLQRIAAAGDQPQIGVQCDVRGSRGIAAAYWASAAGRASWSRMRRTMS